MSLEIVTSNLFFNELIVGKWNTNIIKHLYFALYVIYSTLSYQHSVTNKHLFIHFHLFIVHHVEVPSHYFGGSLWFLLVCNFSTNRTHFPYLLIIAFIS